MQEFRAILIVGFGNMAGAMVEGWLASGLDPSTITAVDPQRKTAPDGVRLVPGIPEGEQFDLLLLAVKPQLLAEVAPSLNEALDPDTTLLSILAGVEAATLAQHFPDANHIVRLMPNLAAALRKSANSLFAPKLDSYRRERIGNLVSRLGDTEWLPNEDMFHAVTALAGSGPGFVFRYIEALAKAGSRIGLDPEAATRIAVQMTEGAAALAAASDDSPRVLAQKVASPGGTTQAGLDVLEQNEALDSLVADCLEAARNRSREMARGDAPKG